MDKKQGFLRCERKWRVSLDPDYGDDARMLREELGRWVRGQL
jgi:hypothetical protein